MTDKKTNQSERLVKGYEIEAVVNEVKRIGLEQKSKSDEIKKGVDDLGKDIKGTYATKEELEAKMQLQDEKNKPVRLALYFIATSGGGALVVALIQFLLNNYNGSK